MNPPEGQSQNQASADPNLLLERRRIGAIEPLSPWRFHRVPESIVSHRLIVPVIVSGMAAFDQHGADARFQKPFGGGLRMPSRKAGDAFGLRQVRGQD